MNPGFSPTLFALVVALSAQEERNRLLSTLLWVLIMLVLVGIVSYIGYVVWQSDRKNEKFRNEQNRDIRR